MNQRNKSHQSSTPKKRDISTSITSFQQTETETILLKKQTTVITGFYLHVIVN